MMLQVALLLLACGLSQYIWSVNTSVAHVVISFTTLGILFYIGIVAAGTYSYECPFQTPVSIGLRYLRDSTTTQRLLASLSLSQVISLAHTIWMKGQQGVILAFHYIYDIVQYPLSWEISLSNIMSSICHAVMNVGHQAIILFLQADHAFGNVKLKLIQGVQRFSHAWLLPTTTGGGDCQPLTPQNGPRLQVHVLNLEALQKQNVDNAHCVSWVLHNITDPEAIDSAIRLAGTIHWFNGDPNHDPPFALIVSAFGTCFDSTGQLYPGMRDQAYFSARAMLQINMGARAQSHKHASKYPILAIPSSSSQHTDPDLHHIILMLELNLHKSNSHPNRPTFSFPSVGTNTHTHSLWVSNLLVDLTHTGPNPILRSYSSYLSAAFTGHQAVIANTLLMWYMFLGGHVEEETVWAVDKSYVTAITLSFSPLKVYTLGIHYKSSFLTWRQE